jgi:hypothetical protein
MYYVLTIQHSLPTNMDSEPKKKEKIEIFFFSKLAALPKNYAVALQTKIPPKKKYILSRSKRGMILETQNKFLRKLFKKILKTKNYKKL